MTKHDALRKQRIIDYIASTVRESGYPPSVREIAAAVGLASTSAVHHHLSALEKDGLLERDATQSRALRLKPAALLSNGVGSDVIARGAERDSRAIPVLGEIAAGGPIEAYQDGQETVSVPDIINASSDTYVLRVRGDSMVDAHIMDGDLVVIREQQTAHDETSSWPRSRRTRSRSSASSRSEIGCGCSRPMQSTSHSSTRMCASRASSSVSSAGSTRRLSRLELGVVHGFIHRFGGESGVSSWRCSLRERTRSGEHQVTSVPSP